MANYFYDEEIAPERITRFLAEPQNYLFGAYVNGKLAGFVYGYILTMLDSERSEMFLYSLDVLPEYQRQGIGRALIESLKAVCREKKLVMFVFTNESNEAGMGVYPATGAFRPNPDDVMYEWNAPESEA
jgi:ribosomal protein S18 acetylase RimI-like enzyme